MNSKQLIQDTLIHKQPARVPIDFGGTGQTGIHVSCVEALHQHCGLPNNPVIVSEPYQMLGFIDD